MRDDRGARDDVLERSRHEPPRDVGPQGEALILELQRLRQAFERDDWNERHAPPRRHPRNDAPRRRAPQRRKKKRGMGRVIEVCLEQFGLVSPEPLAPRPQPSPPPHPAPPPRAAPRAQAAP